MKVAILAESGASPCAVGTYEKQATVFFRFQKGVSIFFPESGFKGAVLWDADNIIIPDYKRGVPLITQGRD